MASGGVEFVEMLGRSGRLAVLRVAARRRTYRELARIMGVSPAAVSKYMSGRMSPSEAGLARLLDALDREEAREVALMILEYLAGGLRSFIAWAASRGLLERSEIEGVLAELSRAAARQAPRAS
ncbi:helix-turn-helix domain-containing protein [Stetteria hydrogenophila]